MSLTNIKEIIFQLVIQVHELLINFSKITYVLAKETFLSSSKKIWDGLDSIVYKSTVFEIRAIAFFINVSLVFTVWCHKTQSHTWLEHVWNGKPACSNILCDNCV